MYAPAIMASCTQEGAEVVALRQGSLMKRNRTLLRSWDRRFFTLDSAAVLAYHSLRHQPSNGLRVRQVGALRSCVLPSLAPEGLLKVPACCCLLELADHGFPPATGCTRPALPVSGQRCSAPAGQKG